MRRRIAGLAALAMLATHGCGARSGLELLIEDGGPVVDATVPPDVSIVDAGADVPTIDAPVIDAPLFDAPVDAGPPIVCEWSRILGIRADLLGLAVDPLSNIVISGRYQNGIDFGSGPAPPDPNLNGFIAKLDPNGATLWSHVIGGDQYQNVRSTGVDDAGNVYVLVLSDTTIDLGLGPNVGVKSVLAKYDAAGNLLWNHPLGLGSYGALAVGHDGTSLVVYRGQADGGPADTSTTLFVSIDASGKKLWDRWFDNVSVDLGNLEPGTITLDATGRAVVVGQYTGSPDLGGGPLPNSDNGNLVFALDAAGNHVFSAAIAVPTLFPLSISVLPNGETVVVGNASTPSATVATLRIAQNGALLDTRLDHCHVPTPFLDVDAESGNILLAAPMTDACDFGGGPIPPVFPLGTYEITLLQLGPSGEFMRSGRFGGDAATAERVVVRGGAAYLGGSFQGTVDFGPGPESSDPEGYSIYVAKCPL